MLPSDDESHSEFEISDSSSSQEELTESNEESSEEEEEQRPRRGRKIQRQYGVPLAVSTATSAAASPAASSVEVSEKVSIKGEEVVETVGQDAMEIDNAGESVPSQPPQPPARVKKPKAEKIDFFSLHPDLKDIWDLTKPDAVSLPLAPQPPRMIVQLLPFQLQGLQWMLDREATANGGILADEMGMGKTIQMISLIVSDLDDSRPNLVVCPAVALMQWYKELETRTGVNVKVLVHHGPNRCTKSEGFEGYNVVLTTYAILEQGYRKEHYGTKEKGALVKRKSIIHKVHWHRFILDEAHAIKDRYSNTARACFGINADKKWCLSGTPLQNRVGELFSLIRLMDLYPHSYYFCTRCNCKSQMWRFTGGVYCDECGHTGHQHFCYWNREILKPIQKYGNVGDGLEGFKKLGSVLDKIMLRRTKINYNDELGLPPRIVESRRDLFSPAEEELYKSLYSETTREFSTYVAEGTVLNNYASIFSLLSRMRLAANHPDLVISKLTRPKSVLVCGICQEEAEDPIISKCKHLFCREDVKEYIACAFGAVKCPVCVRDLVIDITQETTTTLDSKRVDTSIVNFIDLKNWKSSTKIEALVEELEILKSSDTTIKSLVFSQFTSFLDLVHWRLTRSGFNCVKLDGRMSPAQRAVLIDKFNSDVTVTVFLISLKAGGIALNLTEASRVFVMDPWWNPAVEDQAMDRIHRLGQYRPIKITRMVIENSIESRILELQEKKKALFESTIGQDQSSLSRLSEEDFRFLFVL